MPELYAGQHGNIQEMYLTYLGELWGSSQRGFREDFLCSPYCISKVSQSRPGGDTMSRGGNMSSSTGVEKQQDSKYRQPRAHSWGSMWARRAARAQRVKVAEHHPSDKNISRVRATGVWRFDSWPYWAEMGLRWPVRSHLAAVSSLFHEA